MAAGLLRKTGGSVGQTLEVRVPDSVGCAFRQTILTSGAMFQAGRFLGPLQSSKGKQDAWGPTTSLEPKGGSGARKVRSQIPCNSPLLAVSRVDLTGKVLVDQGSKLISLPPRPPKGKENTLGVQQG